MYFLISVIIFVCVAHIFQLQMIWTMKKSGNKTTNGIALDHVTTRLSAPLRSSCNVSVQNCLMGFKYTLRCAAAWRTDSIRRGHISWNFRAKLKFKHASVPVQRDSRPISRPRDANVNLTSFTPDLAGRPTGSFRDWHSRHSGTRKA